MIVNYRKKLAASDPEANPIRGPLQPPSWEMRDGPDFPDVSDDDSEGDEFINVDRPVSLLETRKEMGERMEKKVNIWFAAFGTRGVVSSMRVLVLIRGLWCFGGVRGAYHGGASRTKSNPPDRHRSAS